MFELVLAEVSASMPDAHQAVRAFLRLLTAGLCGALIGLQRELLGKPAGLRTHILVACGTALFVVAAAEAGMALPELSRVVYGLATGVGFIGAGAILKLEHIQDIKGLTTAADIWLTAAIGVTAGLGRLGLALMAAILAWAVLAVLGTVSDRIKEEGESGPGDGPRRGQ